MPSDIAPAALREMARAATERAATATPGPWWAEGIARGIRHWDRNWEWYRDDLPDGFNLPGRQDGDGGRADGVFVAAAREDVPALAAALTQAADALEQAQRERDALALQVTALREAVRWRVLVEHWTGTAPDAPHMWSCLLCSWIWADGHPESHDADCPATPHALATPAQAACQHTVMQTMELGGGGVGVEWCEDCGAFREVGGPWRTPRALARVPAAVQEAGK